MATGTVKWFSSEKSYGFIEGDDGSGDYFVHFNSFTDTGYQTIEAGQHVRFEITEGERGKQASDVEPD